MSSFDIKEEKFRGLKAFTMHGTSINQVLGDQVQGDCPFCSKENHFYINYEKLLWDCKVCNKSGNLPVFLEKINERNIENLTMEAKSALAEDRGLPVEAFKWVELGYYEGVYTIAVRNPDNKLIDLRLYKIGGRAMSTAGSKTGMFGARELMKDKGQPAYICEGEWDTIAMQWLLSKTGKYGRAVCSPGATTFKPEWADYFQSREVFVLYDNDEAGKKGETVVLDRLIKKVRAIKFLHWPENLKDGYDVRDHITRLAVQKKLPKRAISRLLGYFKDRPRLEVSGATTELLGDKKELIIDPSVTFQDVIKNFQEVYHQPSIYGIEMALITILASIYKVENPPWVFLVAPPSSGKTAIINTLKYFSEPYDDKALMVSHITTHSLISGMETKKGDPSLFAQLDGTNKSLIIKDFTGVLSQRAQDKEEIYGQLRDGHDGTTAKMYGNGVKREYKNLKFPCLAGVTEAIYDESNNFQSLGERFAKLNIGQGGNVDFIDAAMHKALDGIADHADEADKLAMVVYSCGKNLEKIAEANGFKLPPLSKELKTALVALGKYVGQMRGVVSRDKYKRDLIKSAPSFDVGIRNVKMLATICQLRAVLYGRPEATLEDLPLVKKIALDTINQRDEEILREIYLKDTNQQVNKVSMQQNSRYTPYTIRCVIDDLVMLKILEKKRLGRKYYYEISAEMRKIIDEAKLYTTDEEKQRANPKVRLNRSKTGEGKFSAVKVKVKRKGK